MKEPRTNADAHKAKLVAKEVRDLPGSSITDVIVADEMEKLADQKLAVPVPPRRGTGGELMPPLDKLLSGTELAVSEPSMVSVDASIARIDLADRAGVFDLAFDAAETIGAKDAIEQMLAHQMAAAHKSAMTLLGESAASMDNSSGGGGVGSGGGGGAYGTKVARWMKQYEISDSTIEELFHKDGDTVEVIVGEVPGDGKRGESQNCYLLSGVRALLESDEPKFTEAAVVSLCKHMGCHDQTHHAKTRSSLGNIIAGSKTSGFTLPGPGLRAAAELVKAMAKQG